MEFVPNLLAMSLCDFTVCAERAYVCGYGSFDCLSNDENVSFNGNSCFDPATELGIFDGLLPRRWKCPTCTSLRQAASTSVYNMWGCIAPGVGCARVEETARYLGDLTRKGRRDSITYLLKIRHIWRSRRDNKLRKFLRQPVEGFSLTAVFELPGGVEPPQ
jgi:hypothetical protein